MDASIGTYTPTRAENPFDQTVTDLIAAGDEAALTLANVSAEELSRTKKLVRTAANDQERTARIVEAVEHGDASHTLVYVLVPRQYRERKPEGETVETDETPEPVTAPSKPARK